MQWFYPEINLLSIQQSPLKAILMEGSPSTVLRGYMQDIELMPGGLSKDPDEIELSVCATNVTSLGK